MNIGDTVINKKIGPPISGKIIAIYDPTFWLINMSGYNTFYDKYYDDWKNKPLVTVLPDTPIRPVSFEEFCEHSQCEKNNVSETVYKLQIQPMVNIVLPIDDLEVLS